MRLILTTDAIHDPKTGAYQGQAIDAYDPATGYQRMPGAAVEVVVNNDPNPIVRNAVTKDAGCQLWRWDGSKWVLLDGAGWNGQPG